MREEVDEEPNWFARWEEQLPSPEELMPLSQTLITPGLALAFDIPTGAGVGSPPLPSNHHHHHPHHFLPQSSSVPGSDFDSSDFNSASAAAGSAGAGGSGDGPPRTLKRPRLVWTPQLHKRFVDAVAHLGIKNAVPKTIMQLMSVDGLTRENVASHLQKYRLYLKRMQGLSASGGGAGGPISGADAATDQLFASASVPHHFLARGADGGTAGPADPFLPFMAVTALQHHQQINVAATMQQQQQQFYHQRHIGHYGSPTSAAAGGRLDHGFLDRAAQQTGTHGMTRRAPGTGISGRPPSAGSYVDEIKSSGRGDGGHGNRKVLTLFPTGED